MELSDKQIKVVCEAAERLDLVMVGEYLGGSWAGFHGQKTGKDYPVVQHAVRGIRGGVKLVSEWLPDGTVASTWKLTIPLGAKVVVLDVGFQKGKGGGQTTGRVVVM